MFYKFASGLRQNSLRFLIVAPLLISLISVGNVFAGNLRALNANGLLGSPIKSSNSVSENPLQLSTNSCLTKSVQITLASEQISFCAPTNLVSGIVEDSIADPNVNYGQFSQTNGYGLINIKSVASGNSPGNKSPVFHSGAVAQYRQDVWNIESAKTDRTVANGPVNPFWRQPVTSIQIDVSLPTTVGTMTVRSIEWDVEHNNRLWSFTMIWDTQLPNANEWSTASKNFSIQSPTTRLTDTAINLGLVSHNLHSTSEVTVSGGPIDVGTPSWWSGQCNNNNYSAATGYSSFLLGSSWHNVVACGPRPQGNTSLDHLVRFYTNAWGEYEFECVELVMRFLYQQWGIGPWPGNGNTIKDSIPSSISFYPNGSHSLVPGDIITENASPQNYGGHTAIVTYVNLDANGTGTINILEQNSTASGSHALNVTNWNIAPDPYAYGQTIQGWLHVKANEIEPKTAWDFRSGPQGWVLGNASLNNPTQLADGMLYNIAGNDPYLVSPTIDIAASKFPYFFFRMSSEADSCGQVYFRRAGDAGFDDARYLSFTPIPDASLHAYFIDLSAHPLWAGNIVQLRLDPACTNAGNHAVRIDELGFLTTPAIWDFRKSSQEWVGNSSLSKPSQDPNGAVYTVTGDDPYLFGPLTKISTQDYSYIYVKMSTVTDACGQIFFRREQDADFVPSRSVNFAPVPGSTYGYIIGMSDNSLWTNNVIQLRLDPACFRSGTNAVRIDEVSALSNLTAWDFRNGTQGWIVGNTSLSNPPQTTVNGLLYNVTGADPYIFGPMINASANNFPSISLKMATWTDACGQIFFRRQGDADFSASRYVSFTPTPDGNMNTYTVPMTSNSQWTGNIIQLRLDPACNQAGQNKVEISDLTLTNQNSPANAAPPLNYYVSHTPTLSWSRVSWAQIYQIEVSANVTFSGFVYSNYAIPSSALSETTTSLANGPYYWRVRACNAPTTCGGWSNTDSFVINAP